MRGKVGSAANGCGGIEMVCAVAVLAVYGATRPASRRDVADRAAKGRRGQAAWRCSCSRARARNRAISRGPERGARDSTTEL